MGTREFCKLTKSEKMFNGILSAPALPLRQTGRVVRKKVVAETAGAGGSRIVARRWPRIILHFCGALPTPIWPAIHAGFHNHLTKCCVRDILTRPELRASNTNSL
jgi:hypothetical protein